MCISIPAPSGSGKAKDMSNTLKIVVLSERKRLIAKRKGIFYAEWTGNIFLWVSGAILTISPSLAKSSWVLFMALFIGQLLWGVSAFILKKWSLFATSVFFCIINIYGVIVRF